MLEAALEEALRRSAVLRALAIALRTQWDRARAMVQLQAQVLRARTAEDHQRLRRWQQQQWAAQSLGHVRRQVQQLQRLQSRPAHAGFGTSAATTQRAGTTAHTAGTAARWARELRAAANTLRRGPSTERTACMTPAALPGSPSASPLQGMAAALQQHSASKVQRAQASQELRHGLVELAVTTAAAAAQAAGPRELRAHAAPAPGPGVDRPLRQSTQTKVRDYDSGLLGTSSTSKPSSELLRTATPPRRPADNVTDASQRLTQRLQVIAAAAAMATPSWQRDCDQQ